MKSIVKMDIGHFPKIIGLKECPIYVILGELKMEKNILSCLGYTHIKYNFQNICQPSNLFDLLTLKNNGDLETLLFYGFKNRNKNSKEFQIISYLLSPIDHFYEQ